MSYFKIAVAPPFPKLDSFDPFSFSATEVNFRRDELQPPDSPTIECLFRCTLCTYSTDTFDKTPAVGIMPESILKEMAEHAATVHRPIWKQ